MSTITDSTPAPRPSRIALHAVGLLLAALANPLIYYDQSPVVAWLGAVAGAVAMAVILYGLFWLLFPRRARAAGAQRLVLVLWFSMGLMLLDNITESWNSKTQLQKTPSAATPAPSSATSTLDKDGKPCTQITDFLGECRVQPQQAPGQKPAIAEPEPDWERGVITPPPSR